MRDNERQSSQTRTHTDLTELAEPEHLILFGGLKEFEAGVVDVTDGSFMDKERQIETTKDK